MRGTSVALACHGWLYAVVRKFLSPRSDSVKRTLARVVKVVLVIVIAAGASARLLQAQLPQGVGTWLSTRRRC